MDVPLKIQASRIDELTYERLREAISDGTFPPGTALVEARLAADYGVSKTPVREALIRLQRDGLVQLQPYRGARVTQLSAGDVRHICEMRRCLEGFVAGELARTRPPAVVERLYANVAESRDALERDDQHSLLALVPVFTDILVEGHGNPWILRTINDLRSLLQLIGAASLRRPHRFARSVDDHGRIAASIAAGDAHRARATTIEHILSVEADSLEAMTERRPLAAAPPR
jgi:DNA-binding GntR family transcriptional regulator